jgi:hypothetical protein
VALGTACSSSGGGSAGTPTTVPATAPRSHPTTTTAPATTPTTTPADPLDSLILGDILGYTRQPNDVADTGPTDIAKATLDDVGCNVGCDARAELVSAGFERGYERQWSNVDASLAQTQDFIFLYRFQTPNGAGRYAQHWRDTLLTTNQGAAVAGFTPAFVPGGIGLRVTDTTGSTGIVIVTKGQYAVKAQVTGGANVDESGPASSLAALQFQRLP